MAAVKRQPGMQADGHPVPGAGSSCVLFTLVLPQQPVQAPTDPLPPTPREVLQFRYISTLRCTSWT